MARLISEGVDVVCEKKEYPFEGYDIAPEKDFRFLESRLHSFRMWPIAHPISAEKLALAGFVYRGIGDKVECFSCKVKLSKFEADDIPWIEHVRWSPRCSLVRKKMESL